MTTPRLTIGAGPVAKLRPRWLRILRFPLVFWQQYHICLKAGHPDQIGLAWTLAGLTTRKAQVELLTFVWEDSHAD